jgi:hypothetical protein
VLPFCAGQSANVFQRLVSYPVTTAGAVVATADFNGDGKLDVIVEDGNTAAAKVFFGNGDGTLTFHSDLTLPIGTAWVAPGDVNGDGITGLATAQFGSAKVTVLLGNGDGSFHMGYQYSGTFASSSLVRWRRGLRSVRNHAFDSQARAGAPGGHGGPRTTAPQIAPGQGRRCNKRRAALLSCAGCAAGFMVDRLTGHRTDQEATALIEVFYDRESLRLLGCVSPRPFSSLPAITAFLRAARD